MKCGKCYDNKKKNNNDDNNDDFQHHIQRQGVPYYIYWRHCVDRLPEAAWVPLSLIKQNGRATDSPKVTGVIIIRPEHLFPASSRPQYYLRLAGGSIGLPSMIETGIVTDIIWYIWGDLGKRVMASCL